MYDDSEPASLYPLTSPRQITLYDNGWYFDISAVLGQKAGSTLVIFTQIREIHRAKSALPQVRSFLNELRTNCTLSYMEK